MPQPKQRDDFGHRKTLGGEGNQKSGIDSSLPDTGRFEAETVVHTRLTNGHRFQDKLPASIESDDLIKQMLFRSFDQLPLGLVVWRAEEGHFSIVRWHNLCQKVFGWTSEEIIGRSFLDLLSNDEDRSTLRAIVEKLGPKYIPSIMFNQCHTKSNEQVLIKWCHTPIFDEQSSIIHVVSLAEVKTSTATDNAATGEETDKQRPMVNVAGKKAALQAVVAEIENEKEQMLANIRSNLEMIISPILRSLAVKTGKPEDEYSTLLKQSIQNLGDPFTSRLESNYSSLTPREVEVCNMIKSGLSSKQVANSLNISEQTVVTQRKRIRRKVGIANSDVSLAAFLRTLESSEPNDQ